MLSDRFIVLNADIILQVDLISLLEFHSHHGGLVTIGLTEVDDPSQYGVVEQTWSGEIVRFVEKPAFGKAPSNRINAGIYVMEKEALRWIPKNRETSIERETFPNLIRDGAGVYGTLVGGYWMDMGTLERYLQLHVDILNGNSPIRLSKPTDREGVWLGRTRVKPNVRLIPPVVLGDGVVVESGCTIGPFTVLGPNTVVGAGSSLSHTVVWPDTYVASGTQETYAILSDRFVVNVHEGTTKYLQEAVVE